MPTGKGYRLDLSPLKWLGRQFRGDLPEPLPRQWAIRYSAFARRRFTREGAMGPSGYSRKWKALEPATRARRRKAGRGARILRNTGTLLGALTLGAPGNLFKKIRGGVRFGFGGSSRHPDGKATIADIARYHDAGDGVPQRMIIVPPDARTIQRMGNDLKRVVGRLSKQAERRMKASMRQAWRFMR